MSRAVAVGLAAVAAEAGLAWLKRRTQVNLPAVTSATRSLTEALQRGGTTADADPKVVTIVSQRVVEFWDQGSLTRQIVEKHVWKKEG